MYILVADYEGRMVRVTSQTFETVEAAKIFAHDISLADEIDVQVGPDKYVVLELIEGLNIEGVH